MRSFLCTFLVAILGGGAVAAQNDGFPKTRAVIEEALQNGLVSASVAHASDGEIVWQQSWGWADREARVRATPHTLYSLASISKPITATGLMVLVERGEVDLDRPINDYLGGAKLVARVGDADDATVRLVANHTSGLPLHYQFFYRDEPRPVPSRDETILRYGNLVSAPGERFQYSNLGYGVLDHLIARVSGMSYEDFMREEVFAPLDLGHCAVGVPPELEKHAAQRYGQDDRPIPFYDFDHAGASAVYCSAHDLLRFGMFHLGNELPGQKQILSEASRRAMVETTSRGSGRGYGVAWGVQQVGKVRRISHSGGMGGVATSLTLVPEENAAFVVLLNSRGPLGGILEMLLHEALPRHFDAPSPRATSSPPVRPSFKPPDQLVGTWRGEVATYAGAVPMQLRVLESGDLHVRLAEQFWALVNEPSLAPDGLLRGRFLGELPTEDTQRDRIELRLQLELRGDVLNGSVIALTRGDRNKVGNALTHWAELKRGDDEQH